MGVSTDGQICCGVLLEEEIELPWDADQWDGDIDAWWRDINGFKHSREVFDADGHYLPGFSRQSDLDWYYGEERDWDELHGRVPVELVNACSAEYPIWIVALPGSCHVARRGDPEKFDPTELCVEATVTAVLTDFLDRFGIEYDGAAAWYLSSYWG